MPYAVTYNQADAIVNVQVSGAATKADHYAARDEALRLCQAHKCTKILVDLRALDTHAISTMGCFTFGESLARTSPVVWIAHVLPSEARAREDVRFTSTVESNRGKPTGEFETLEEARAWLLRGT